MAAALELEKPKQEEHLSLEKQMTSIQEEARMVLPGIQALFGFELIAVFNDKFGKLTQFDKNIHLAATGFTLVAIGLTIAPAALHRIAEPDRVSEGLVRTTTRLLAWGLLPLTVALALDFYLFSRIVLDSPHIAMALGSLLFIALVSLWFAWPAARAKAGDRPKLHL